MRPQKRVKVNEGTAVRAKSVLVQFLSNKGVSLGVYDVGVNDGPAQFKQLVNNVLGEEEEFNFFYKTKEIKSKLQTFLKQIDYTEFEATLAVVYHPVSAFRVRPITRASSSMYGHTEAVLCIQFSGDSEHLASGSGDGSVRLWDVHTQTPLKEIPAEDWVMVVAWAPDAEKFALGTKRGGVSVYSVAEGIQTKLAGHSKWVTSFAWMPLHLHEQCRKMVSASKDGTLRLYDSVTGTCERSFGNHSKCVTKVVWTGGNEIISCAQDQRIMVHDATGNYLRDMGKHAHWVNTLSLSTDAVLRRGCFALGQLHCAMTPKEKHTTAVALFNKAQAQRMVSGSDDFTLQLFILPAKKATRQMVGHGKPINYVQFSPDGRYIASGSFDKKMKLWDGYSGEFMYTFDGHVGPVYLLVWAPDSRFIISGSQDSTLKLWDIKTRKLMMDLPGHADQVYALDWDNQGRLVASGGKDRQLKLWTN